MFSCDGATFSQQRLDSKASNDHLKTSQADDGDKVVVKEKGRDNEISINKIPTNQPPTTTNETPSNTDKMPEPQISEDTKQSQEDSTSEPQCYNSPCGYIVTVTPSQPDDNGVTKLNSKSPPRQMPSPIRYAFPVYYKQSMRTRPRQSKQSKPYRHDVKNNNIAVIEYDRLVDATGGTCVAILANQFESRIVDTYEYDPSQSEEPVSSTDSKGIVIMHCLM